MAMSSDYTPADDSFQVILPSTACTEMFRDNRANSYRVHLMKPIECKPPNQWEFALMDIQFPHNWPNVLETTFLAFFVEIQPTLRDIHKQLPPDLLNMQPVESTDVISECAQFKVALQDG